MKKEAIIVMITAIITWALTPLLSFAGSDSFNLYIYVLVVLIIILTIVLLILNQSQTPILELYLIDEDNNIIEPFIAKPIIHTGETKQIPKEQKPNLNALELAVNAMNSESGIVNKRGAPPNLVSVKIGITNKGDTIAERIRIFLDFPSECELMEKNDIVGHSVFMSPNKPTSGGLYIDEKNNNIAKAWMDELGNDLSNDFDEIYVKFPAKKGQYTIQSKIIQKNYKPIKKVLVIDVEPEFDEQDRYTLSR